MTTSNLDPDERQEVHNARILELQSGEISGKEFVQSLVSQVGFTQDIARAQWQAMKDNGQIAIYDKAKCRCMVEYPVPSDTLVRDKSNGRYATLPAPHWRRGMITSMYGNNDGAIVQTGESQFALRVPFSLYELRLAK